LENGYANLLQPNLMLDEGFQNKFTLLLRLHLCGH
jgi:hypothetical protein